MSRHHPKTALLLALLVTACGGGGGGGSNGAITSQVTGVAIDGYLKNATVFLDKNDNGIFDAGEASTTTRSDGSFSFDVPSADLQSHAIIAIAIPTVTVDMDAPSSFVTQQFSLTAPLGKNAVISPITTLIAAKVSTGMTLSNAESAVKADLGLPTVDLYKDYIVASNQGETSSQQLRKLAVATTEILKSTEVTNASAKSLNEKLTAVNSNFATNLGDKVNSIKSATDLQSAAVIGAENTSASIAQKLLRIFNSIPTISAAAIIVM